MLDTGPLGKLAHPRRHPDVDEWFTATLAAGVQIIVPEIADYELRRNMLLTGLHQSIIELNELRATVMFQPITTPTMLRAAELWAMARRGGTPTAGDGDLDGDVILAAQALEAGAIVASDNSRHLSRYVTAKSWKQLIPSK